jgi:hypothetical protein
VAWREESFGALRSDEANHLGDDVVLEGAGRRKYAEVVFVHSV